MAKKKKKRRVEEGESVEQVTRKAPAAVKTFFSWPVIIAILAITFACYYPVLNDKKEFTNWDDATYIIDKESQATPVVQHQITSTSFDNIKKIFSPSDPVSLNYHPLTMLSLAYNYKFAAKKEYGEPSPKGFFITNLFLHLCNTFLVFVFLYLLSRKRFWVGAISALLFGIHPMHVESVAWASERKDVLYCFFFLASCISYIYYLDSKKIKFIAPCVALFVLSCLSKAMAAPLPFVLILIDIYRERKINARTLLEKIPFFALMLVFGLLAVHIQSKEAIADFQTFTLYQRFMFAAYGFLAYWAKLFVPVKLSAFYPYPAMDQINAIYYLAPLLAVAFVLVPAWYFYKNNRENFRLWVFGMGFFIFMVAMVLQFVSVGAALMADRYTYLPYIGAFFILATFIDRAIEGKNKNVVTGITAAYAVVFAAGCYLRVGVWENSYTLWTDVIKKYPYVIEQKGNVVQVKEVGVVNAYKDRGNYFRAHNMIDSAFADYQVLVRAHAKDDGAYTNTGNFYGLKGQEALAKKDQKLAGEMFSKALEMYSEALKLKQDPLTYINRGITYSSIGRHQDAITDFRQALSMNPQAMNLYGNIGWEELQLGKYNDAIADCSKAINAIPNDPNLYYYRGTAYVNTGHMNEAVSDLERCTQMNPKFSSAWINLSIAYDKLGNKAAAENAKMKSRQ